MESLYPKPEPHQYTEPMIPGLAPQAPSADLLGLPPTYLQRSPPNSNASAWNQPQSQPQNQPQAYNQSQVTKRPSYTPAPAPTPDYSALFAQTPGQPISMPQAPTPAPVAMSSPQPVQMTRAPEVLYSTQPAQMMPAQVPAQMPTQVAPAATSSQAQPDVQQLLRQQEQYFQTAMVLNKLQEQTGKILLFIENLDNRMSRLESITRDIYDRVSRSPPAIQPAPAQQAPVQSQSIGLSPIGLSPMNAASSSRRNRQEEADEEFARQLQEEEARKAKKAEKKEAEKKEAERKEADRKVRRERERERERDKAGECPVCAQSFPMNALEAHVEQCLANSSLDQQTQEQKKSFFANWFKKKDGKSETPAATPAPATASAVPVLPAGYQLPPGAQVIRAPPGTTYFPQAPYMMGGYPGTQLPPGAQVIYYNPMDQGNK